MARERGLVRPSEIMPERSSEELHLEFLGNFFQSFVDRVAVVRLQACSIKTRVQGIASRGCTVREHSGSACLQTRESGADTYFHSKLKVFDQTVRNVQGGRW